MDAKAQSGYFLLADISGYTSFVARTELEHAHEILTDLLEVIVAAFKNYLTISKLEGDAVFAYVPDSKFGRGEVLLELIESTYGAFRDRQDNMHRATTCTCQACRQIPSLDLKFMAHHGHYIVQKISDRQELIGSDVNLIHRLLKNSVSQATGWKAYALITQPCLEKFNLNLDQTHEGSESYEHLGVVKTFSLNLHPRYNSIREARREFITAEAADLAITQEFPIPPMEVWEWINNPEKRKLWDGLDDIVPILRPQGRLGVGARNHCKHGKTVTIEDFLDWRPFDYFTVRFFRSGVYVSRTCHFVPLANGGTRLHTNFTAKLPLPAWLNRRLAKPFLEKFTHVRAPREKMMQMVLAESHSSGV